jgi:predicted TIM-barrel fold metal-dependent hydrolase
MSQVIDADAHVLEGPGFFGEALQRWPDKIRIEAGEQPGIVVEGRRYPEPEGPGAGCPPQHGVIDVPGADPSNAEGVLADADKEGIDRMVLFPSFGLGVPTFRDLAFGAEIAGYYNDWLSHWVATDPERLSAVAVVPLEDVNASIERMTQARAAGHVCTVIPPALRERNLDHPDLDPFYAAAADLGMPLGVHGAPGVHLPKIGVDRFTNYIQVHCISFPFDQMTAMTAMISGGVFERHPGLRVAFLESGCGWVSYFLDRMHEHWEKRGDWIPGGWKRPPREYLERGQVHVTCEAGEPMLGATVADLGAEFIMYASDYPHWDSEFPNSSKPLRERDDLDEAARAAILGGNAARFFGLS